MFRMIWQKFAYLTEYLQMYELDLHQIFRVGGHVGGDG